jgi:magnesium chelatase family protein
MRVNPMILLGRVLALGLRRVLDMLASTFSASLAGTQAHPVRVEVHIWRGLPVFELVGLAEAAVRESKVRVKSALAQLGVPLSDHHVTVNLAPADLRKAGSGFDLAIAIAVLVSLGRLPREAVDNTLFVGELSLSGGVYGQRGILPLVLGARQAGFARVIVPKVNEAEAALARGIEVRTASTLAEVAAALAGDGCLPLAERNPSRVRAQDPDDLSDVRGQATARRALEIAAAGGHNLMMMGPPGAGKTMLARRLPGILPPLSEEEFLEVMVIHSVAGMTRTAETSYARPFRAPHHTVSEVALVGGADPPRPGEVSLAHGGVLFLDELAEFRRSALEALRQPLEDGTVTVSRAHGKATFQARATVVAAMNPCPCGHLGDPRCGCSPERVRSYRGRLSGPLLDRLDVQIVLPPVRVQELSTQAPGESSKVVRARVANARERQLQRVLSGHCVHRCNADLLGRELEHVAAPDAEGRALLEAAFAKSMLSMRAYTKVLRMARTLADLDESDTVRAPHVAEALQLRAFDRGHDKLRPAA